MRELANIYDIFKSGIYLTGKARRLLMNVLICSIVFIPMTAAIVSYITGRFNKNIRNCFAELVTGVTFGFALYLCIQTPMSDSASVIVEIPYICGLGLHFTIDGFRAVYGTIAAFMWFMSTLFSEEYFKHYHNRNRYYMFLLLTLGATEGVFYSADFYTTFIFFEIMSLTSYMWVAHDEKKESMRAAATYLAVAVIGGLVMLMGIFLLYDVTGTLFFNDFLDAKSGYSLFSYLSTGRTQFTVAGLCMLFGFGAKAGAFPLHIWLPKAHPVAPAPASALLSGILTKAGMYGILILTSYLFLGDMMWGNLILVLGVCTMVVGAVLALFSVDLKRTLACSSVSQIGFILVGVGMSGLLYFPGGGENIFPGSGGNLLAVRGSMLHMVNHSLIKLALFMAAGVIFMNIHKLNLNDIRGFGHGKPLLNYIFLMGALGIGGIPLWNGYISKTLIHESIVEYIEYVNMMEHVSAVVPGEWSRFSSGMLHGIEWAFLISGGLTIAYMTKLYVAIFVEKNTDATVQASFDALKGKYMNKVSAFALTVSATLLPVMGFLPHIVMDRLANMGQNFMHVYTEEGSIAYFSLENLKGAAISLGIGVLVYFVIVRLWMIKENKYVNRWYWRLDLENLIYRPVLLKILPSVFGFICRILDSLVDAIVVFLRKTVYRDSKLPQELPEGTPLTHMCACVVGFLQKIGNKTIFRKHPRKVDYDHKFAMFHEEWFENSTMIARSMSFGLLLFCVGLLAMIGYLFIMDIF